MHLRALSISFVLASMCALAGCGRGVEAPPSPIAPPPAVDGTLPSAEGFGLSAKASCSGKPCRFDQMIPEAAKPAAGNAAPAAMWEQTIAPGASVTFPRGAQFDVLGVTLSGAVTLVADDVKGERAPLGPWRAFVAPGGGVSLSAKTDAARLVLIVVTSGEPIAPPQSPTAWTDRPAALAEVDLAAQPDLAWGKGAYHARIGFGADASRRASLGVLRMSAEAAVPAHNHEKEWEHMAILQGDGDFSLGAPGEERPTHGSDGTVVSVPAAMRHEWRPTKSRPFLGIQVYTPPGPEQRFKKLAASP